MQTNEPTRETKIRVATVGAIIYNIVIMVSVISAILSLLNVVKMKSQDEDIFILIIALRSLSLVISTISAFIIYSTTISYELLTSLYGSMVIINMIFSIIYFVRLGYHNTPNDIAEILNLLTGMMSLTWIKNIDM
jgi:hypothetical protein